MKKHFLTGLIILLPLALTVIVVSFLVNLLTAPFIGMIKPLLDHLNLFQHGLLFYSRDQAILYVSQFIILGLLFGVTVLLGAFTRWFILHRILHLGDYILHKIPVVSGIYRTIKDVTQTLFSSDANAFKQVALVPFPNSTILGIGFVTRESIPTLKEQGLDLVAVFVPTTPNPTSGFLMMFPRKDLVYLEMSVEEAFKYIISCGVLDASFQKKRVDLEGSL